MAGKRRETFESQAPYDPFLVRSVANVRVATALFLRKRYVTVFPGSPTQHTCLGTVLLTSKFRGGASSFKKMHLLTCFAGN